MSTPQITHTLPPQAQLATLEARRNALLLAAQEAREAADLRREELAGWKRDRTIPADYSIDSDHRIRALLAAAERYDAEAVEVDGEVETARGGFAALRQKVAAGRRPVRKDTDA